MRTGMLWRSAVLASLALLMSGQLCMLTTCVPRMKQMHSVAHACCRATPAPPSSSRSSQAPGAMPCGIQLHGVTAPLVPAASLLAMPAALPAALTTPIAPPARVVAPFAETDTGPPRERLSPAPAGVRAPPQA